MSGPEPNSWIQDYPITLLHWVLVGAAMTIHEYGYLETPVLVRLQMNGLPDPAFTYTNVSTELIRSLILLPDGKIMVNGNTRLNPDGGVASRLPWNCTEVFSRLQGSWKIIHTHWSYLQHTAPDRVDVPVSVVQVPDEPSGVLGELMRLEGFKKTPRAVLSRAVAGIRGRTLVVNLPGRPKAVRECLEVILDLLPHAIEMLHGGGHG